MFVLIIFPVFFKLLFLSISLLWFVFYICKENHIYKRQKSKQTNLILGLLILGFLLMFKMEFTKLTGKFWDHIAVQLCHYRKTWQGHLVMPREESTVSSLEGDKPDSQHPRAGCGISACSHAHFFLIFSSVNSSFIEPTNLQFWDLLLQKGRGSCQVFQRRLGIILLPKQSCNQPTHLGGFHKCKLGFFLALSLLA